MKMTELYKGVRVTATSEDGYIRVDHGSDSTYFERADVLKMLALFDDEPQPKPAPEVDVAALKQAVESLRAATRAIAFVMRNTAKEIGYEDDLGFIDRNLANCLALLRAVDANEARS